MSEPGWELDGICDSNSELMESVSDMMDQRDREDADA